jgi:hypothetical protein
MYSPQLSPWFNFHPQLIRCIKVTHMSAGIWFPHLLAIVAKSEPCQLGKSLLMSNLYWYLGILLRMKIKSR